VFECCEYLFSKVVKVTKVRELDVWASHLVLSTHIPVSSCLSAHRPFEIQLKLFSPLGYLFESTANYETHPQRLVYTERPSDMISNGPTNVSSRYAANMKCFARESTGNPLLFSVDLPVQYMTESTCRGGGCQLAVFRSISMVQSTMAGCQVERPVSAASI
jgi:hypothetical protein